MSLINFAFVTIFAREVLEGAIIIGEYRTIILRGDSLKPGIRKEDALREVTISALFATALALLVIAAIAIPLALLSKSFDPTTAKIIEGVSKIVAAISLLQLSLKLPKWLGVYGSKKQREKGSRGSKPHGSSPNPGTDVNLASGDSAAVQMLSTDENQGSQLPIAENVESESAAVQVVSSGETQVSQSQASSDVESDGLSLRSIRFNVAWNIWREVAECGVFLTPYFLSGEGLVALPLSATVGFIVGFLLGVGIYVANKRLKNKVGLVIFAVLLLVVLSAGLFTGGCHSLEVAIGSTRQVWTIQGDFWSVDRLPMTVFKPFGYNDSRTLLEILCYWFWLGLAGLLHYRKYRISPKPTSERPSSEFGNDEIQNVSLHSSLDGDTAEMGESSLEGDASRLGSTALAEYPTGQVEAEPQHSTFSEV